MKLSLLGGGGFRVPQVYQALLRDRGTPRIEEIWLHDTDAGRLEAMARILDGLGAGQPGAPRVRVGTDLDEAIRGSDFVFTAVRVGGLSGRVADERVALGLGVLGQETTGPGGIAFGLRTIPVMLDIARRVAELAPRAYVVNFTNPAGMITEAMQRVLGDRVLGICDTPSGLGHRIALAAGVDPDRIALDYVGLNHLGWMRRVLSDGTDLLPGLLADEKRLASLEETTVFGADWLRGLGMIPNEYMYYYYFTRDAVASILAAPQTRGEFLLDSQGSFFDRIGGGAADPAGLWQETTADRSARYMAEARGGADEQPPAEETDPEHSGYAGVARAALGALARNERATLILNVRNGSTLAGLPADAVVEVPTLIDAAGVHPLATAAPGLAETGLMQQVKAVERLTIEAAVTGSRDTALRAFALHPLVDSVEVARRLLDGYLAALPDLVAALPA